MCVHSCVRACVCVCVCACACVHAHACKHVYLGIVYLVQGSHSLQFFDDALIFGGLSDKQTNSSLFIRFLVVPRVDSTFINFQF